MTKILFGDDDEEFRESYKRAYLRNFTINEISNSTDLVEMAKSRDYNLIITDNDYEDNVGGIEAIRRIREFDTKTPVLIQTADLSEKVENNALKSGANYVLNKRDYDGLRKILESFKEK